MPPILGAIGAAIGFGTAATATTAATTAAIVAGTVVTAATVAGTGAIISNARRRAESTARAAKQDVAKQSKQTNLEIDKLQQQQDVEAKGAEEAAVRTTAREKQRRKIASARGRRSTILTSPLGTIGPGATVKEKELVGT